MEIDYQLQERQDRRINYVWIKRSNHTATLDHTHRCHRTSQYTYLGMILCENGSMKQYVERRTQSSINTMGSLYDSQLLRPGVSLECRMLPYNSLVLPIMTHACETLFYGSDMTFLKTNEYFEKRNHSCIRQL